MADEQWDRGMASSYRGCAKQTSIDASETVSKQGLAGLSGPLNSSVTRAANVSVERASAFVGNVCDQESTCANRPVTSTAAKQLATPRSLARSRESQVCIRASGEHSDARVSQPTATAAPPPTVRSSNGRIEIRSTHSSASANQFNHESIEKASARDLFREQHSRRQEAQADQSQQLTCRLTRHHQTSGPQDAAAELTTSELQNTDLFVSKANAENQSAASVANPRTSTVQVVLAVDRQHSSASCQFKGKQATHHQHQHHQPQIKDKRASIVVKAGRSLYEQEAQVVENAGYQHEGKITSVSNPSFWAKLSNLSRSIVQQQQSFSDSSVSVACAPQEANLNCDIGAFLAPEVVSYLETKKRKEKEEAEFAAVHSSTRSDFDQQEVVTKANMTKTSQCKSIVGEQQETHGDVGTISGFNEEAESGSRLRDVKREDESASRRRKRGAVTQITSQPEKWQLQQQETCPSSRRTQVGVGGQNVIKSVESKHATISNKMQQQQQQAPKSTTDSHDLELAERLEGHAGGKASDARHHQVKLSIATNATNTTTTNTSSASSATRSSSASSLSSCILSESMSGQSDEVRLKWGKKMDFLLSIIGFAVDLANIWRFPYLVYKNGGGVFLIPYLTMLIFGGIPLFFLELCLGQYVKKGPITVWNKICPYMKGVGYCSILISWYVSFYYNVLIAWSVYFIYRSILSFGHKMPWEDCDNSWNTVSTCVSISQLKELCSHKVNVTLESCRKEMFSSINVTSPASEFFVKELSQIDQSSGLNDMGYLRPELVFCTMIVYLLHYFSLFRGLETSGKVVWVTATAPYMILSILLVRGLFLPGASMGIEYYLSPRLEKLADPGVWIDAAGQVFYSIGVGFGVHLTYASFNSHDNNCYRDCLMTSAVNALTSVYSGLVVFVYLGYMATNLGIEIDKVASEGYSLVFEVYPEALTTLPFARFWSILFFIMLLTLGIDSAMGGLEAVITGLEDEFKFAKRLSRGQLTGLVIVSSFLPALISCTQGGAYTLFWFDIYSAGVSLLFSALFETIGVVYCYGLDKFILNIESMLGTRPQFFYIICWKYISPTFLMGIIFMSIYTAAVPTYRGYTFPLWSVVLGWCLAFSSVAAVPIVAVWTLYSNAGNKALSVSPSKSPRKANTGGALSAASGGGTSRNVSRKSTPSLGHQCRKTISTINYSDIAQQSGTRATSSVINLQHEHQPQHRCYKDGTRIEEEML